MLQGLKICWIAALVVVNVICLAACLSGRGAEVLPVTSTVNFLLIASTVPLKRARKLRAA